MIVENSPSNYFIVPQQKLLVYNSSVFDVTKTPNKQESPNSENVH